MKGGEERREKRNRMERMEGRKGERRDVEWEDGGETEGGRREF